MAEQAVFEVRGKRVRMGSVPRYVLVFPHKIEVYEKKKHPKYLVASLSYHQLQTIRTIRGLLSSSLVLETSLGSPMVIQGLEAEQAEEARKAIADYQAKAC